jgi:hypothetical protein
MGFFMVKYDSTVDIAVPIVTDVSEDLAIESDDISLRYLADYDGEGVYFELTDKVSGVAKTVGFDLRFWQSFQSDNQQNSGVYIFRPKDG